MYDFQLKHKIKQFLYESMMSFTVKLLLCYALFFLFFFVWIIFMYSIVVSSLFKWFGSNRHYTRGLC